jgi:prepilin-type processing-associated H-X9-DG protein
MIYVQLKTESGSIYQVNVVNKKIRKILKTGEAVDWTDYVAMANGAVGESLNMSFVDGSVLQTTPILELEFPQSKD